MLTEKTKTITGEMREELTVSNDHFDIADYNSILSCIQTGLAMPGKSRSFHDIPGCNALVVEALKTKLQEEGFNVNKCLRIGNGMFDIEISL